MGLKHYSQSLSKLVFQAILVPGRKLLYEVKGASTADEEGFFTLVRLSNHQPSGVATGLFNWKSGTVEVCQLDSLDEGDGFVESRLRITSSVVNRLS